MQNFKKSKEFVFALFMQFTSVNRKETVYFGYILTIYTSKLRIKKKTFGNTGTCTHQETVQKTLPAALIISTVL